jgi:hypothetical protein
MLDTKQRRGLGPFNGTQLTVIICVIVAAVAIPVGASAVTGSNTFVTDATTGTHAKVDSTGNLQTKVVGGSVTAYPPGTAAFHALTFSCNQCAVAVPPSGKAVLITSIHLNMENVATTGDNDFISLYRATNSSCSTNEVEIGLVNPSGLGETVLPFEPGFPIQAGKALCIFNHDPSNLTFDVSAFGLTTAATGVPST